MSKTFSLTLDCDNAAFRADTDDESSEEHADAARKQVALILRDAAKHIEAGSNDRPLHDSNGNKAGKFFFIGQEDE